MEPVFVRLRRHVVDRMIEHARRQYPRECCGLLAGQGDLIEEIFCATNQKGSPHQFFIPPGELLSFFKRVRVSPRKFLGIYHSHPDTEAVPSPRDIAEFHYPGASYWIISLREQEPDMRCFLWGKMGFEEVVFTVVPDR